jgi:hypothetical protein
MTADTKPKIPIKRKIGKKTYTLEGTYAGKYFPLSYIWDRVQRLKQEGYVVGYEEKMQGVGKRKPVPVTLIWVHKP